MARGLGAALAIALLWAMPALPGAAAPVPEETVSAIAAQLRCVVCQNLSVEDSPSETARQMRDIIRERLAAGESPDQVVAYFVERYGTWILLSPPRRGFTLIVWIAPFAALGAGLVAVGVLVRRWSRRTRGQPASPASGPDADMQARIRREVAELDA